MNNQISYNYQADTPLKTSNFRKCQMRHKTLIASIIAFIVVIFGLYFFISNRNAKKIQWYLTSKPISKSLTQYINASGRLKAQDQITVGSLVAGRVVKLLVDDNDFVKKDQVLVELDDGIGYSAVKKAKANLLQSQASLVYQEAFYKRQASLYNSGQLAKDTFESYSKNYQTNKAQVLAAQADLEIAQQAYDNLFIKAPEAGVVIAKKVDLGQMVTARLQATELFIIAKDLTKMEAEIDVDEADIGFVKIGQDATFTVDAFPQKPFRGKVKQINYDYKIIDNVITYAIILDVDNPDMKLRPGMTTNVDLKVATAPNALCVPNKALRVGSEAIEKVAKKLELSVQSIEKTVETKAKETLWVLEKQETFVEIEVKLGVTAGRFTQVLQGITPDTEVVTEALDPERENPIMMMGKMKA